MQSDSMFAGDSDVEVRETGVGVSHRAIENELHQEIIVLGPTLYAAEHMVLLVLDGKLLGQPIVPIRISRN